MSYKTDVDGQRKIQERWKDIQKQKIILLDTKDYIHNLKVDMSDSERAILHSTKQKDLQRSVLRSMRIEPQVLKLNLKLDPQMISNYVNNSSHRKTKIVNAT